MNFLLFLLVCLWSWWGCKEVEEDKEGKRQMGVEMGILVVGDRCLVGVIIVQSWLV